MALTTNSPSLNMPAWDSRMSGALKTNGNVSEDDKKLKKACQEMEAVFLNMLLKSMRATVPKSESNGSGMQSDTMQSMFDMEMTRNMAAAGGTVSFVDDVGCATAPTQSAISGNTAFDSLSIVSSSGKLYQFAAGSTQTVTSALTLQGSGAPLRIRAAARSNHDRERQWRRNTGGAAR